MHILLIHQFFLEDQQGGGNRWNDLSRIWVQQGHMVTVLAGGQHYMGVSKRENRSGIWSESINQDGIRVIRCRAGGQYPIHFIGRLWSFLRFSFLAVWAGLFHARDRYHLVVSTSPPLVVGVAGAFLGFVKKVPVVFEIRDLWPESAMETGVVKKGLVLRWAFWLERWIYKNADLLVVLTPAFTDWLIEKKGVDPQKIICIPNAADLELSQTVAARFDRDQFRGEHDLAGRFVITYVGAHGLANHLGVLHDLAQRLADTPVLFLLIGDGREKEGLMLEANRLGLSNLRFEATMPKAEVLEYIMASEMGLSVLLPLPIFNTIYSNKTFDYMACRKPVLMGIAGVSRHLIEVAQAGIYIDFENGRETADRIRHCMQESKMLKLWGQNGYRYVEKYYNRRLLAQTYLERLQAMERTNASK